MLVGQNVSHDTKWLEMQEGRDYRSIVDLGGLFRAWNTRYNG